MKKEFDTIQYIAIPYKNKGRDFDGCDCWGLVRLVYEREFGISLLSLDNKYEDANVSEAVKHVVTYGRSAFNYTQKDKPEMGDIVVFTMRGNPCHVGVYIGENRVLHVMRGTDSTCEKLDSFRLKGKVEGYYEIR